MAKNKLIKIVFSSVALALAIGAATFSRIEIKEAKGYDTSSLPTTIDLNDSSSADIRSYYSGLNNLSESERKGTNLLKNLKTILKNGQKYYSYDSGNAIWQMYEITDRDWDKSPASSTTYGTYNASTNKITNYQYGTSSSSSKNNPYIHALYINRNVTNQTTAWDDHQQNQWGINREHVWPKAEGFETSGTGGARGDPMHLMAGNGYSNNIHSNYYYGYVNTSSSYTNCGSKYSNQSGNLLGKSKTLGGSTNVFEPQDCDKGDIARAIFYMVARYNYLSGSDTDGINSNNPNLTLTQSLSDWSSTGYSSTTSNPGKMGILTDLLAWHHADPVDNYEIHRNNLLYKNFTNNRNPFIDFPEWVDFIWGTATYNGTTYSSYNSTPTGYAQPRTDTINSYNSGSTPVEPDATLSSITISGQTTSFALNGTFSFGGTVTARYSDGTSADVTSSSTFSGYNMATSGKQTVTVSYTEGNVTKTTTYQITVSQSSGTTTSTSTGSINASGGALSGWTASGTGSAYADGSVKLDSSGDLIYKLGIFSGDVSAYMTNLSVTINGKINGSPTDDNSYKVEAISGSSNSITVKGSETKTGSDIVTTSYRDTTFEITSGLAGTTGIRITYVTKGGGNWGIKSVSWTATYSVSTSLTSITLDTTNVITEYTVGDVFSSDGLVVTAHYSDNTSEVVDSDYTVTDPDMSTDGTKTITVTYYTQSASYEITVNPQIPTSISAYSDRTFYVGDVITTADINVEDNYGNSISDFSFTSNNYQFTYFDASSGGIITDKTFANSISWNNLSCSLTVEVQRKEREDVSVHTDTLNQSFTGVTGTSYSTWSNKVGASGTIYAGNSAAGNSSIQLRSGTSTNSNVHSGIIMTTSINPIKKVSVSWNTNTTSGREIAIYGKNSAYSSVEDLYSNSTSTQGTSLGSIIYGTSTELTISGSYLYIGIKSTNGALYLDSMTITIGSADTASNLANYLMFEDTTGQCTTKFGTARGYFEDLSTSERTTFMTSNDYVIAAARERLLAWAANQHKTITLTNGDYVVSPTNSYIVGNTNTNNMTIVVVLSLVALTGLGFFLFIKKKKEN